MRAEKISGSELELMKVLWEAWDALPLTAADVDGCGLFGCGVNGITAEGRKDSPCIFDD